MRRAVCVAQGVHRCCTFRVLLLVLRPTGLLLACAKGILHTPGESMQEDGRNENRSSGASATIVQQCIDAVRGRTCASHDLGPAHGILAHPH